MDLVVSDNSLSSHILLIAIVGAFSIFFYIVNRRQHRGIKVVEGVVCTKRMNPNNVLWLTKVKPGFRYTY